MQVFPISPREMIVSVWRNRNLIVALTKREVVGRYRGSMLGLLWSFFNPIFMLAVYTFVFSVVFKAKWGTESDSKTEFALVLFAGLIIFNLFAECVNRAPGLILLNVNYVKKVVFPLEILPVISFGAALFHGMVSLCVWLVFYILIFGLPHLSALLLPIIILPFMLFILGLSWILASLGVYLRDISQFIGVITTTLMFLSPIFYPISVLPENFQLLLHLNPLTLILEDSRNALIWGKEPDLFLLSIYYLFSTLTAFLGFAWFQKTRKGFADVI